MKVLGERRPTVASVIAVAALVCAMSGTAVAGSSALHDGDKVIAKHTLSGNRLRPHTVTAHQVKPPAWHSLKLLNTWSAYDAANYGAPAYAIDDQGFVHLRGVIKAVDSAPPSFTQLPPGFRPSEPYVFVPVASVNGTSGPQPLVLIIQHNGFITADAKPGDSLAFVSLAGVTFAAG